MRAVPASGPNASSQMFAPFMDTFNNDSLHAAAHATSQSAAAESWIFSCSRQDSDLG